MGLEEQIAKGKRLITQGKSLGKDTKALEEKVKALEAQHKQKESLEKTPSLFSEEEHREVIRDDHDYKLNESIHAVRSDRIQETLKKNVKPIEVTIRYCKGNLRIEAPDIQTLYLGIKRDFPKDSIISYHGAVYVAFYYLPVVIKTLEEWFGNIDIDSSIPEVEIVRRFLPMRQVYVEKDLAAELEHPFTKALLKRKSQQEIAEITSQLRAELRRSKCVDFIWEKSKKEEG